MNHSKDAQFKTSDTFILIILVLTFAPLYLRFIEPFMYRMHRDELFTILSEKSAAEQPGTRLPLTLLGDFCRPSTRSYDPPYFLHDWPAFIFYLRGRLGNLCGGVTLSNMRFISGFSGLCIIVLCYLFLRYQMPCFYAVIGTLILGANHALIGFSNMALVNNSALLVELLGCIVLLRGFQHRRLSTIFIGGAVTGLSLHVYLAGGATIVIWFMFLGAAAVLRRDWATRSQLLKFGLFSGLGFVLVASPILVASLRRIHDPSYLKNQLLIFPQGRQVAIGMERTSSVGEAVRKNIVNGLLTFNKPIVDHSWLYPNYYTSTGFVDPITGTLLWIGLFSIFLKIRKGTLEEPDLLASVGFLFLWLFFACVTGAAPSYTRLLVILPFVAYLSATGLDVLSIGVRHGLQRFLVIQRFDIATLLSVGTASAIVFWNLWILQDVIEKGYASANDLGSTVRFIESKKNLPHYIFYLALNAQYPYFISWEPWFDKKDWETLLFSGVGAHQELHFVLPEDLETKKTPPFTAFMDKQLWLQTRGRWMNSYPRLKSYDLVPYGQLVAVDVY